jgi:Asp-tRNA(Asn)/Glu-tRNA(Gln) amidotransferase C subunit
MIFVFTLPPSYSPGLYHIFSLERIKNLSYDKSMSEKMEKIFKELREIEALALKLRTAATDARAQTDLEVAILSRQLAEQKEKNKKANEFIDQAIEKLKGKPSPPLTIQRHPSQEGNTEQLKN